MRGFSSVGLLVGAALIALAPMGDAAGQPSGKAALSITARGFKGTKGQAIVALYSSKDSWLKTEKAVKVVKLKIEKDTLSLSMPDLAPGNYAVAVIHDENSNGKLDMHWLPIPGPDEGSGISNDAAATMGPPSYGDAQFKLGDGGGSISLKMRY